MCVAVIEPRRNMANRRPYHDSRPIRQQGRTFKPPGSSGKHHRNVVSSIPPRKMCRYSSECCYSRPTVLAFSIDLREIKTTTSPVTWSLGYVRDPSIFYYPVLGGPVENRRPYFFTQYSMVDLAVRPIQTKNQ